VEFFSWKVGASLKAWNNILIYYKDFESILKTIFDNNGNVNFLSFVVVQTSVSFMEAMFLSITMRGFFLTMLLMSLAMVRKNLY